MVGLTTGEKRVVLFVLCLMVIGIGVDCYKTQSGRVLLIEPDVMCDMLLVRVDINTAGQRELETIPGIGEKTAAAIIAYRSEHGSFGTIYDIMRVRGIKQKKFRALRQYLTTSTK